MPTETAAEFSIEYRQALGPDGSVDDALLPSLSPDHLRDLYRQMKLARRLDERAIALQRRGELGTYAPGIGQEGAQVGSAAVLDERDWLVPSFREQAAAIARGASPASVLEYALGLEEGAEIPDGTNALPPSIPVGSQALHAAGVGWGERIQGSDAVALTFFGDGATSEGDVYEAMNFAGVYGAGVVFLCQNNQYAISTPRRQQTRAETLAQTAVAAGIDGVQVDGNDVLGVYATVEEAVAEAREGRPVLVEALTYRRSMHTTADDPTVYRTRDEETEWEARDPILRFELYLREQGVLDDETVADVDAEIESEIEAAIAEATETAADADPVEMFDYVFAETPPTLAKQREAFLASQGGDERGE